MTAALIEDDTASPLALPSDNIERDRLRALREYEEEIIGFRRYRAWNARLDYQQSVGSQVAESLATAVMADSDAPITRDTQPAPVRPSRTRRRIGKFARSL